MFLLASGAENSFASSSSSPVNALRGTEYKRMTGCEKEHLSVNEKMQEHAKNNMSSSTGMNPVLLHMYIRYYRTNLVRIFNKNILALGHLHAEVCNSTYDTPPVSKGHVQLAGEVRGTH